MTQVIAIEKSIPLFDKKVKVRFEIPVKEPSEDIKKMLNMSVDECLQTCYQPIVDSLAYYLTSIQCAGNVGATAGLPVLQSSILEAGLKFKQIIENAKKDQEVNS